MKKKLIIAIVAAIVVIGGGIGGYVYHSNQVKDEKMANYNKALSDYRFNSNRLIYSLDFIATDFIINWNSAIMNKKAMNAKNFSKAKFFKDIREAYTKDMFAKTQLCKQIYDNNKVLLSNLPCFSSNIY